MRAFRLIPVLLIHNLGVYKTKKFKRPIYIGDPINTVRLFNDLEVDEIIILDIDASKNKTEPNFDFIEELASEAFMPFAYGGGIQTIDQAQKIIQLGAEKIVLNHQAHKNNSLISDCAKRFGSQSIVVSIDYKKKIFSEEMLYDHVSKKILNKTLIDGVLDSQKAGAGELMITSVERDGQMEGMDISIIKKVSSLLSIPLIPCGGIGSLIHIKKAHQAGAEALAAGSFFVFYGKQNGILINYPKETELEKVLND